MQTATPLQEGVVTPAQTVNLDSANPAQPAPIPLYWRLDKTGRLTPEEVLSPAQQSFFTPFPTAEMPKSAGTSWFRFSVAPYGGKNGPYYLDLNAKVAAQIPKGHRVWMLREGQPHIQLHTETPGLYLLPDSTVPATIFVRTEGLPAIGFAPILRSAETLTVLDTDGSFWIGIVLVAALFLGLLRGIFEQREWRMWAALYAGTLLVTNAWGFPATPDGKVLLLDLPGLLAPGIALLLLPHVGRHILRSREHSSLLDIQFILIGLIGLVLCLLPLLSNHVWTIRYLPLWPLGMLLLLPTTLQALFQKINGAGRFLTICLLPPLGLLSFGPLPVVQFASAEEAGIWSSLISLFPSLCLCASSLLIALSPTPKHVLKTKRVPTPGAGLEMPGKGAADSPLRLEPVVAPVVATPPLVLDDASRMTPPADVDSALPLHNLERRMRGPLDVLLNEIGTLEQMNLPRDLVDHAHRLSRAGRQLSLLIGEISSGRHISPVAIRQKSGMEAAAQTHSAPFDLYDVILQAHNAVAELAEAKNLALSWFTAPHLARTYNGQGDRLLRVLTLLAESAVHATDRGIVQIRVQRLPESNDPGLLQFTVSDTGKGAPPLQRSSISLVQVWELVGPTGGTLNVESGPTGTSIAFSLRFQALSAENQARSLRDVASPSLRPEMCSALRILVISDVPGSRQLLSYYLDELPHEVREARSVDEALGMYTQAPGALLIFDGDLPENDVVRAIAAIRAFEGENGYPLSSILALVKDDDQIERLRRAGCTHSLLKPVSRTELRQLALRLAPVPRSRAPQKTESAAARTAPAPQTTKPAQQATKSAVSPEDLRKAAAPRTVPENKKRPWSLLSMGSSAPDPAPQAKTGAMPDLLPTRPVSGNTSEPKPVSADSRKTSLPEPRQPLSGASAAPTPRQEPAAPVTTVAAPPVNTPARAAAVTPPVPSVPTPTAQILDDMVRDAEQKMAEQVTEAPGQSVASPSVTAVAATPPSAEAASGIRENRASSLAVQRAQARQDTVRRAVAAVSAERKPMPWPGTRPRTADTELSSPYTPGHDGEWVSEPRPIGSSGKRSADDRERAAIRVTGSAPVMKSADRPAPSLDAPKPGVAEKLAEDKLTEGKPEEKPQGFGKSILSIFHKKTQETAAPLKVTSDVTEWVGEPRPKTRRDDETPSSAGRQPVEAAPVADSSEWVGEPRPKLRPQAPESETDARQHPAQTPPVVPDPQPAPDPLAPLEPIEPAELPEPQADILIAGRTEAMPPEAAPSARPVPLETTPSAKPVRFETTPPVKPERTEQPAKTTRKERASRTPTFQPLLLPGLGEQAPQETAANTGLELRFSAAPEEEVIFNLTEIVDDPANDWPVLPVSSGTALLGQSVADVQSDLSGHGIPSGRSTALHIEPDDAPAPLPPNVHDEAGLPDPFMDEASPAADEHTEVARLRHVPGTPLPGQPGLELVELPDETPVEEQLERLDILSARAQEAFADGDIPALRTAAGRLAETATALGMHGLIDLARCLEEEAENAESTASLLEIIEAAVRDEKK